MLGYITKMRETTRLIRVHLNVSSQSEILFCSIVLMEWHDVDTFNLSQMLKVSITGSCKMAAGPILHQVCWARGRDYCIGSNFWKFYLIRTGFTLDELVFLVKVFRMFRLELSFLVFRAKISLQSYFAKFTCPVSQINFAKSWSSPCYHLGILSRHLCTFAKLQSPHYHICFASLQFHNVIWLFCQIAKSTQCLDCPLPEFHSANSKLYSREIFPYTSKASHKMGWLHVE